MDWMLNASFIALLILFVFGYVNRWWVFGSTYDEAVRETKEWRAIIDESLAVAARAVAIAKVSGSDEEIAERLSALDDKVATEMKALGIPPTRVDVDDETSEELAEHVERLQCRRRVIVGGGLPSSDPQSFTK